MSDKKDELLKKILDAKDNLDEINIEYTSDTNEDLESDQDAEESDIGESLSGAVLSGEKIKELRKTALIEKTAKKRKEDEQLKKELGIRKTKQSKFPTRGDDFLKPGIKALHVVLYNKETDIYRDGADIAPRMIIGIPGYGKPCKKNAFERLMNAQEKIRKNIGDNPLDYPKWIIISNDTSMIMDRNVVNRLEELREITHCAGAYGFETVRTSGKFFNVDNQLESRGAYIQGDMKSTDWDFIVGQDFKKNTKYKISLVHGPFIAVRGDTFMSIDFTGMTKNCKGGFHHYMADISLECIKRGKFVATIKTLAKQYDKIENYFTDPDFQNDQAYFASKWQTLLPVDSKTSKPVLNVIRK